MNKNLSETFIFYFLEFSLFSFLFSQRFSLYSCILPDVSPLLWKKMPKSIKKEPQKGKGKRKRGKNKISSYFASYLCQCFHCGYEVKRLRSWFGAKDTIIFLTSRGGSRYSFYPPHLDSSLSRFNALRTHFSTQRSHNKQ